MWAFFNIFAENIIDIYMEKKITLRIFDDLPMTIVAAILTDLPSSGVAIYSTNEMNIAIAKLENRKNDTYQIYKANGSKEF